MSIGRNGNLHEVLKAVRTRPLFVMHLDVRKLQIVGAAPGSYRAVSASFSQARSRESGCRARSWRAAATGRQRGDGATTLTFD
jgi:hypothetical protein